MNFKNVSYGFMKLIIKICVWIVIVGAVIFIAKSAFSYGQKVFTNKGMDPEPGSPVVVTLPKNASVSEVADILDSYGLIDSKLIFKIQKMIYAPKDFVQGEYDLNTSYSPENIIKILTTGPGSEEAVITGETIEATETTKEQTTTKKK